MLEINTNQRPLFLALSNCFVFPALKQVSVFGNRGPVFPMPLSARRRCFFFAGYGAAIRAVLGFSFRELTLDPAPYALELSGRSGLTNRS